jgi:hypothetical protein
MQTLASKLVNKKMYFHLLLSIQYIKFLWKGIFQKHIQNKDKGFAMIFKLIFIIVVIMSFDLTCYLQALYNT